MDVDVCVIGGGPAGSTLAARLVQLGHAVCLVERAVFPRSHLGESLSPGVLPLLEVTGVRGPVETAGFQPVSRVRVDWDQGPTERVDPGTGGLLVDRGRFDDLLLTHARHLGVEVLQPARVRSRTRAGAGWLLDIEEGAGTRHIRARFVADASGRSGALPSNRVQVGPRTMALYAYWTGPGVPTHPTIEAGADAWYWGVPLPDGSYNTLVFVDAGKLSVQAESLDVLFQDLMDRSTLLKGCDGLRRAGPVRAADATPYLDADPVTSCSIKVGEAAVAIDPISSSGVQKAVQSALSGAVVVNTILRKPESTDAAIRFYRTSLAGASERHHAWASGHYATAGKRWTSPFWEARAVSAASPDAARGAVAEGHNPGVDTPLALSSALAFVELPCIHGAFVEVKEAVSHPGLDDPLAFLGGQEIATLLRELRPGMTPPQVARSWSARVPPETGLAMAAWLVRHGILVPHTGPAPADSTLPTR